MNIEVNERHLEAMLTPGCERPLKEFFLWHLRRHRGAEMDATVAQEEAWRKLAVKWQDQIEIECYDDFIDFIEEHEELVLKVLGKMRLLYKVLCWIGIHETYWCNGTRWRCYHCGGYFEGQ